MGGPYFAGKVTEDFEAPLGRHRQIIYVAAAMPTSMRLSNRIIGRRSDKAAVNKRVRRNT
jgi:hypothetical protein